MDFNEHLADLAADGLDICAPIPRRRKHYVDEFYYPDEDEPQPNDDEPPTE